MTTTLKAPRKPKPVKAWMTVHIGKRGSVYPYLHTVAETRYRSIGRHERVFGSWKDCRRLGDRCIPVTITPNA